MTIETARIPERLTRSEVCKLLDIKPSTLRTWVESSKLDVPKDDAGNFRFGTEHVEALQRMKVLRQLDDRSFDTVRRVLSVEFPTVLRDSEAGSVDAPHEYHTSATHEVHLPDTDTTREELSDLAAAVRELAASRQEAPSAEDLAETIAPLIAGAVTQEVVKALNFMELARKVTEAEGRAAAAEARMLAYQEQNKQLEARLQQLLALPAPVAAKPWWRVWG